MSAHRWLLLPFAASLAAAVFVACEGESGTTSGGGGEGGQTVASSSSSSSSSGTGGAEAGPVECTAVYSTFTKDQCDVLQQDCPLGQTCKPVSSSGVYKTKCVASNGLKTSGERCHSENECVAGLFCVGGKLDAKCAPVCCDSIEDYCNGGTCNYNYGFAGTTGYMKICRYATECQLLTENACEPGLDCHIEDREQGLATCGSPSSNPSPNLGPCTFLNDCGNMQDCFGAQGATKCHYYCYLGDTESAPGLGGCPAGQKCSTKVGPFPVDYNIDGVGLCIVDPNAIPPDAGDGGPATGDAG